MNWFLFRSIVALGALFMVPGTQAATVTLTGSTINYQYDTVVNSAALLTFGTPTIVGDIVRFLPPSFLALSLDGAGTDTISANFIFDRVYSTDRNELTQIQVIDFGDYKITNGDGATTADLFLSMTNNNISSESASDLQSFASFGDSGGLQLWQLTSTLDPSLEFSAVANDVTIAIRNTLTATTTASGEIALIQKKFSFVASTAAVPLGAAIPFQATIWLFGSALGLVGWMRRKKERQYPTLALADLT